MAMVMMPAAPISPTVSVLPPAMGAKVSSIVALNEP
jgi:hypothetical protein